MGWAHILHANRFLEIDPRVPGWDGSPIPYNAVCNVLYRVDEGRLSADDVCGCDSDSAANDNDDRHEMAV